MIQGRQERGANPSGPTRKCTGRQLRCHRIPVQAIRSESLFIILARIFDDKLVALHVRLAKADGLKALEQGNVGLLFSQFAQQTFDSLSQRPDRRHRHAAGPQRARLLPALAATYLRF